MSQLFSPLTIKDITHAGRKASAAVSWAYLVAKALGVDTKSVVPAHKAFFVG